MSATDDEVEQLLRRTRQARERCNNRMALIGKGKIPENLRRRILAFLFEKQ